MSATVLDVSKLVNVVLIAFVSGVGVCTLFGFAVFGIAHASDRRTAGTLGTLGYVAIAIVGLAGSLAAIVYGILELTQK